MALDLTDANAAGKNLCFDVCRLICSLYIVFCPGLHDVDQNEV